MYGCAHSVWKERARQSLAILGASCRAKNGRLCCCFICCRWPLPLRIRSTGHPFFRIQFCYFHFLLVYWRCHGGWTRNGWDMRGKIIDSTLVKALEEAASVFRTCTEKDPENVEHWSWYVATLLGMLCIAFGDASDHNNIKVESEVPERQPLQCFIDIRNKTAVVMRQFVTYAHSHDAPMFHLAISSMLEWNKATFLLHRPQGIGFGLEVRRLYAYHVSCCISFVELLLRSTPFIHNKSYYSRSDIPLGSCNLLEHFHR